MKPQRVTHDATSGFHDIKPLPEFSPFPRTAVLVAVAVLLAFLIARWLRSRSKIAPPPPPPLPPIEKARAELRQLQLVVRDHRISIRDFAARLSLLLRSYLESVLHFPAVEQTAHEIARAFPDSFRRSLPLQSTERCAEFSTSVRFILRKLEELAYASHSTDSVHLGGPEVSELFARTEQLLDDLHELLRREEDRRRSVSAASPNAEGGPGR